jgi:hypothetical protein
MLELFRKISALIRVEVTTGLPGTDHAEYSRSVSNSHFPIIKFSSTLFRKI